MLQLSEPQAAAISVLTLGAGIGVAAACLAVGVLGHYWASIMVAPAMLVPHSMTFFWANRRIQQLDGDLTAIRTAKRALLRNFEGSFSKREQLAAGDTMTLHDAKGNILEIKTSSPTLLEVKVFDR